MKNSKWNFKRFYQDITGHIFKCICPPWEIFKLYKEYNFNVFFFSDIQHLQHVIICLWTILPYHNCPSLTLSTEKAGCNPPGKQKQNKGWEGHSKYIISIKKWISSVQSPSHVQLFVTPWTAARQASLSISNSRSLLKLMSMESVMPSNHFLLPSNFPSIRVFSSMSVLPIK